jgi:Tol biopolymer transport system component
VSRKSISALSVLVLLALAIGAGLLWLKRPLSPPSITGYKQLTRDGLVKTNLAHDDSNLYFTEISGQHYVISKVPAAGGAVSNFPVSLPSAQLLDVSPVHASLLTAEYKSGPTSENPFWAYPLNGGAAQRFGNLTGQEAVWSPDEQHVLFIKNSTIFVAPADGGPAQALVTVPGTPYYPRYSPDGSRIRFSVGDTAQNTSSLWEVRTDGSNLHQLLADWHGVTSKCCGSWTSDGRYFVFQATASELGSNGNLYSLAEPAHGFFQKKRIEQPVALTQGPISFGRPVPSPDSKKIWALGLNLHGIVVKYDPATDQYFPFLSGRSASDLDFSADGQWVTYSSIPDGRLFRCRIDGSHLRQLTFSNGRAALPRWSPDGKQIAYVNVEKGKPWAIYVVPVDGGPSKQLFSEKVTQIDINWSTDGQKIIFGRVTQFKPEGLSILVYDLNTHQISSIPGSEGLFSPRLSPDGRYIAALSAMLTKLMLYDTTTQKWTEWQTVASGALNYPVWSADSKSIFFDDLVSGEGTYCRAKVGESHYEPVFKLKSLERYLGPFGLWSGRAPDGSTLFVQDASTREVYELQASLP